jgi:UDPglucose 6-dehydrogenase
MNKTLHSNSLVEACAIDADVIVLMTEWNLYRGLDLEKLKSMMRGDVFVDLRNVYERGLMEAHGFSYSCVGR